MNILAGVVAAFAGGTANFWSGIGARRTSVEAIGFWGMSIGMVLVFSIAPFIGYEFTAVSLAWGYAAGVAGGLGVIGFLTATTKGAIAIAGPMVSVIALMTAATFGVLDGETLSALQWVGAVVALFAIAALSVRPSRDGFTLHLSRFATLCVVAGGLGFGLYRILYTRGDADTGLWPLAGAYVGTWSVLTILVIRKRTALRPGVGAWLPILWYTASILICNAAIFVSVKTGSISTTSLLASIEPAVTVVWARFLASERLTWIQGLGITAAVVATGLIAVG